MLSTAACSPKLWHPPRSLWYGLSRVQGSIAQRFPPLLQSVRRLSRALVVGKHIIVLPPKEQAGLRNKGMAIRINDIDALVVFARRTLHTGIRNPHHRVVRKRVDRPKIIMPGRIGGSITTVAPNLRWVIGAIALVVH